MGSVVNQKSSSCILCKVVTLNDEEGDNDNKLNEREGEEEDVLFLFRILLEIPPNPGINLVVDGNLINADHLLLLKSDLVNWCDQCSIAINQARKLYSQINEAAKKFRTIQKKIVDTLQKCILNDNESAFNQVENYKAIWRKLCLHNPGRFNNFEYPFVVQNWVSPPKPTPVAAKKKDSHNQTQLSSCHGDGVEENEDELTFKSEDDVKEEIDDEELEVPIPNTKQQRILLIFPEEKDDEDEDTNGQDLDHLSDEDDPLAEDIKEDPDPIINKSQDKIAETAHTKTCSTTASKKSKPVKTRKRGTPSKFQCSDPNCLKYFTNFTNLRVHMKTRHPHMPQPPTNPNFSDLHRNHPELYAKIVRNPETNLFTCPCPCADSTTTTIADPSPCPCPKTFKNRQAIERHIKSKHLGKPNIFPCTWGSGCTRTFSVWMNFQAHMDRHEGTPKWKCDQCDKQFYSKNPLVSHRQREHEDGNTKKPFSCQNCEKTFSCRDYLYIHKSTSCKPGRPPPPPPKTRKIVKRIKNQVNREKTPDGVKTIKKRQTQLKRVECEICRKSVTNLRLHREHMHSTVRKHLCHLCSKSFKTWPSLKLHLKRHEDTHPPTPGGSLEFQCSVKGCRLRFPRNELLERHMENKHGENGEKEPALKCQYCGKGFHLRKNLSLHEEAHENEGRDPFKCQVCGKGFRTMCYLKYHQKHTHKMKLEDKRKISKR